VSTDFFAANQEMLERAVQAIAERTYWSPFPESPSPRVYGETAADEGRAAFEALRGTAFPLDQDGSGETVDGEVSPFGFPLNIRWRAGAKPVPASGSA
jgi:hypothetical protein